MRQRARFIARLGMGALLTLVHARAAYGFSDGIASTVFRANGCPACHGGGIAPSVVLSGPTVVAPGDTVDYTLTIFGDATQNFGGFNVAASSGTLSTGGPFELGTKTISGPLGRVEITHSAPKQGDFLSIMDFSFRWTAPLAYTAATLRGWGNAVNHDGLPSGDAASLSTLDVSSSLVDTATPTATPMPTPPPAVCGDAAPLKPALVTDRAAQACQAAIALAGVIYVKQDLRAIQKCLKTLQNGALSGDPIAQCVGSSSALPMEVKAAAAVTKAQTKARGMLTAKCSDAVLAPLDACADSESALEQCFLAQHRQSVVDAVANEYGAVAASSDKGVRKCQAAIGAVGRAYLTKYLKASQTCLAARNKSGVSVDGAALCVGSLVAGTFVPPAEAKVAAAVEAAEATLAKKLEGKCDDGEIAALDTCGADRAGALACLLCTHRAAVFDLVSSEFGGVP